MSGGLASPLVVTLAAARVGIAARPCRHRLNALEVDEQIDRAYHGRQRSHDDERQYGHRHGRRSATRGRTQRRHRLRDGRFGRDDAVDDDVFVVSVVVVIKVVVVRRRRVEGGIGMG